MIVGNGNIASALTDRPDVTFFASGISDSSCTDMGQFVRERDLLLSQDHETHLVYFSSLSIYLEATPYNQHKKLMEEFVKLKFKSYTIVRIGVIEWGKNPTTIHNVFRRKLANGEPIEVKPVNRWLTTRKEFDYWMGMIRVGEKDTMNITGQLVTAQEILEMVKEGKL